MQGTVDKDDDDDDGDDDGDDDEGDNVWGRGKLVCVHLI